MTAKPAGAFSDLEAVKMAEGMEREGRAFYLAAAEAVGSDQLAGVFRTMADEEAEHLAIFADMAGQMARAKTEEYWDDPDVDEYIRAVVSQKVFPKPELAGGATAGMVTAADALRFALGAEKDTVLFYQLCADSAKDAGVRKTFFELVAEEKKHIVTVTRMLKEAGG